MKATKARISLLLLCTILHPTACSRPKPTRSISTPASTLLFNGTGASPNDVAAVEKILDEKAITYDTADSDDLNALTEAQLLKYRLIIFPGGNYITIGNHLTPETTQHIRSWEDGPQLTGWGQIVAKYPDGTPAIVQGPAEKGWIILCGTHPEAPDSWRKNLPFTTPARPAHDYAATLIDAALHGQSLPHY